MKNDFARRQGVLLISLLLLLGLLSCRKIIPPPESTVSLPSRVETQPQVPSPVTSYPTEEETAGRAEVVIDIPPLVPLLPPLMAEKELPLPESVKIVVRKHERKLLLYQRGELLKMYPVDLGKNPNGPKFYQGDMKTPEGDYCIVGKRDLGQTKFYLALVLNYPNGMDRLRYEWAVKNGLLPKDIGIGGMIEIHGEGVGFDWTQGCIALDNSLMQDLFKKIPLGTSVRIEP